MHVTFSLTLPREPLTLPMVRHVVGDVLRGLGVADECVDDLLLAVSEGCTNAVRHARPAVEYELAGRVDGSACVLRIMDWGGGHREPSLMSETSDLAESGRGLRIMRALVDDVTIDSAPDRGTVVELRKRLVWRDGAPIGRLGRQLTRSAG